MEFIKELKEKGERYQEHRSFGAIKAGNYEISIQASMYHYCHPRKTLDKTEYSSMEIAVFNKKGWINYPRKSKVLRAFKRFNELLERADGLESGGTVVYGWVDVDLINDLFLYLRQHGYEKLNLN